MHIAPPDDRFHYKKCGHEDLYISVQSGNPLAFYVLMVMTVLMYRNMLWNCILYFCTR